jgi:hypothetical protein
MQLLDVLCDKQYDRERASMVEVMQQVSACPVQVYSHWHPDLEASIRTGSQVERIEFCFRLSAASAGVLVVLLLGSTCDVLYDAGCHLA